MHGYELVATYILIDLKYCIMWTRTPYEHVEKTLNYEKRKKKKHKKSDFYYKNNIKCVI